MLLLDEPTNGLDLDSTLALRDVLRDAAGRGCTVLVSTHVLENVEKIAHHIVFLDRGSVKAEGTFDAEPVLFTPSRSMRHHRHRSTRQKPGSGEWVKRLGVAKDQIDRSRYRDDGLRGSAA